jgi:hypothetical protein
MIDLNTAAHAAQAPTLGASNVHHTGHAPLPLSRNLIDTLYELMLAGMSCATLTRNAPGTEPGVLFFIFNGAAMSVFGPGLMALATSEMKACAAQGALTADEKITIDQLFAWLDEQAPRCAHGWIAMMLNGVACKAYAYGFTGPVCAKVIAHLESLGAHCSKQ